MKNKVRGAAECFISIEAKYFFHIVRTKQCFKLFMALSSHVASPGDMIHWDS